MTTEVTLLGESILILYLMMPPHPHISKTFVSSPSIILFHVASRWEQSAARTGPAVTQTQMERPVAASHASISAAALCTDSIRP